MEAATGPRILDQYGNPYVAPAKAKSSAPLKPRNSGYSHMNANPKTAAKRAWKYQGGSPDDDLVANAATLRQMSRQLEYDSPIVDGMFSTRTTLAVGTGLMPDPIPDIEYLGWTPEQGQKFKNDWLRYFSAWAEEPLCDSRRFNNFYELQRIVSRSEDVNGDVFVTAPFISRWNSPFETCVNLVEADCIDNPDDGNEIFREHQDKGWDTFAGVVESEFGHVLGYWICVGDHPLSKRYKPRPKTDINRPKWVFVPCYSDTGRPLIMHMMEAKRVAQRRGVPIIASSIEILLLLDKFVHAYATKAEIQALFTAVILSEKPDAAMMELEALMSGDVEAQRAKDFDDSLLALGSGIVQAANPGDKIQSVESTAPSSDFGQYIGSGLEMVGPSFGVSKGFLTHQFNNSYSAARAETGLTWSSILVKRGKIERFSRAFYNMLMDEAVAKGYLDLPGYFDDYLARRAYQRHNWRGPGMPQIDPRASIAAYKEAMALGVITGSQATAEYSGGDYYENVTERGHEISAATAAGLTNPVPAGQGTKAAVEAGQGGDNAQQQE